MAVTVVNYPSSLPDRKQIVPIAVPHAAAEDVATEDVYLEYALFNATSGSNAVVTLTDKQGTPVQVFRTDVDDKAPVQFRPDGRYCPGGLTWQASGAGIIGYLIWRK